MFVECLKRFLKHPLKYLKSPAETFAIACSVIKGSEKYQEYLYKEHKRIYGLRNRDKVFYVICPGASSQGLFSIHNDVLWKIKYAIDKGYIPVVDYQNYANMYLEPELIGKVNAWEYYFNQPTQYGLKDIKHSRHVIICDKYSEGYRGIDDEEEVLCFNRIINMYCTLNNRMSEKVKKISQMLLPAGGGARVLGVLGRGTDYTSLKPYRHAKVPDIDLLVETIEQKQILWGTYDYIYLATEDIAIYETLKKIYGDKLLTYDALRFEHDTGNRKLSELGFERENDKYLKGEEYLITIYLLAECDSIITPAVGGGLAAIRINGGKYKHKYIFHLGEYD